MVTLDKLFQRDVLAALSACKGHFAAAAAFSFAINLLYLATPIYMLQVYDRVLASGSLSTLAALTVVLLLALLTLAALDFFRAGLLARSGLRLENRLSVRVMGAMVERANATHAGERGQGLRDLDSFRQFIAGGGVNTFFDAPWAPLFILAAFLMHFWLGMFALICAVLLLAMAVLNQRVTRDAVAAGAESSIRSSAFTEGSLRNAEVIQAMGMLPGVLARWSIDRRKLTAAQLLATERSSAVGSGIRFFRLFMQSSMLGLGAYLVIDRAITPGQMFAATILLGRALQPIEQAVAVWRQLASAWAASARLGRMLSQTSPRESTVSLPRPSGRLAVEQVTFMPQGTTRPILRAVNFALEPGEALAVVGPTASGKTSLARLLVGVHAPSAGAVRLDGASVHAWDRTEFGRHVGYVPQDIELFAGSVADNISRFQSGPDEAIVEAAQAANAHDLIVHLPNGYETQIGEGGALLSAGQRQRIALARALYGKPALVVLDEPNSNLDEEGDRALIATLARLKRASITVVIVTHRSSALSAVDQVLALQGGAVVAVGPRAEVMTKLARLGAPSAAILVRPNSQAS